MDSSLITTLSFWGLVVILILGVIIGLFLIVWRFSFNVPVWVFEKRGDKNYYLRKLSGRKIVDVDGNVKYILFSWNIMNKKIFIKPTEKAEDIYRLGNGDMLFVSKDSNENYCHIKYNYDSSSFENIPSEVHFWASNARRERAEVHRRGIDWATIGAYGVVFTGLIITLVMVIFTLDWASNIQCGGGSAPVDVNSVPLVSSLTK